MTTAGTYYYPPSAGTGNLLLANPPFIFQSMDTNQPAPTDGLPELTEDEFLRLSVDVGGGEGKWGACLYDHALQIARAAYRMGADVELGLSARADSPAPPETEGISVPSELHDLRDKAPSYADGGVYRELWIAAHAYQIGLGGKAIEPQGPFSSIPSPELVEKLEERAKAEVSEKGRNYFLVVCAYQQGWYASAGYARQEIKQTKDGVPELTESRFLDVASTIAGFGAKHTHYTHEFTLAIAQKAYQLGANVQLDADVEWMESFDPGCDYADDLRAAMRPKPPSLKQQALIILDDCSARLDAAHENTLRRALEALPE